MAAQYEAPALDFAEWCEQAGETVDESDPYVESLQQRFLAERIGAALRERRELIAQRDALADALADLLTDCEQLKAPFRAPDSFIDAARAALAIPYPEANP